jgi:hypothetical protein
MRITQRRRVGISSAALALAGLAMLSPAVSASAAPMMNYGQYTCSSGILEPGTYISVRVTGYCTLTDFGTVVINGDLRVAHNATFNAVTDGTLVVYGSFYSGTESISDIGCNTVSVGPPCTTDSDDVIEGHVYSDHALEMSWHNVSVGSWYKVWANNGVADNVNCQKTDPTGTPDYFTFEDGSVNGDFTYQGLDTCWLGLFRTHIHGNLFVYDNHTNTTVPGIAFDSPEIATNFITGAMYCTGNYPNPTFGDSHGKPNVAQHGLFGQCKHL